MTAAARREQLLDVAREVFAERGFGGTSIEEIATRADVSKPVVYEHFGGKEGLYTVVVEREINDLVATVQRALVGSSARQLLEQATLAVLQYVEERPAGFRILVRDAPVGADVACHQSILGDLATRVEDPIRAVFAREGMDLKTVPMYAQMLAGAVTQVGRWWLDADAPDRRTLATHVVNLTWYGLSRLEHDPLLVTELPPRARSES